MKIVSLVKTENSFLINFINKDNVINPIELSSEANFCHSQLTKYDFNVISDLERKGFNELRKLGLLKLDEQGLIVEPVALSNAANKLNSAFVDLQFKEPGTKVEFENIIVDFT
jgi:hypothetical protein